MSFAVSLVVNPLSNRGQNDTQVPSAFLIAAPKKAALKIFFSDALSLAPQGGPGADARQAPAAAEGFHGRWAGNFRRGTGRGSRSPTLLNFVVMDGDALAQLGVTVMASRGGDRGAGVVAMAAMTGGCGLDFMAPASRPGCVGVAPRALDGFFRRGRGMMRPMMVRGGGRGGGRKGEGEPHRGHKRKFQQTIEQASHVDLPSTPRTGPKSAARMQLFQHHGDEAGQVLTD